MTNELNAASTAPSFEEDDGSAPADLLAWLQTQTMRGCVSVSLRQRTDEGESLVSSWPMPGSGPHSLARAIDNEARTEGRSLRGPTLFVLYAFKDNPREHFARRSFRIEGEAFQRAGETEPPTMAGVSSMLMRHSDAATRIALGHTSNIIEQYKTLLVLAQRRISDLEKAIADNATLRETFVSMDHERQVALQRAKIEDKRADFIQGQLEMLIPTALSRVISKDGPPAMADQIIRQFLGSLKPSQVQGVMSALTPEQQVIIGDLYMRYAATSKDAGVAAEAQKTGNGAPPHTNGATNGAA